MKTAAQNRQTAQAVLAQRPADPSELEAIHEAIEREAESGGFLLTVQVKSSLASITSSLEEDGYVVTNVTVDTSGTPLGIPGIITISWE